MTDFLWAVEYSLLDLLKYFSFFLVVFNFPIYKKKISVPIYFIFSMLCCLVYFEIRGGDRGFSGIPNICSFLFVILIEKGKRIKGFLYMVLTWLIMDFLPGTVRMLFYDLLEDERYLQGALVGRPLWDKILVLVISYYYKSVDKEEGRLFFLRGSIWGYFFEFYRRAVNSSDIMENFDNG